MKYSKWFLSTIVAVVALCIIIAYGSGALATGSSLTMSNPNNPVPFAQFIQAVTNARYSDFANLPTTKVQNEQEFNKMRLHILSLYAGKQVTNSYIAGVTIDCVVVSSTHTSPLPSILAQIANHLQLSSTGNSSGICKPSTFPMQRVTLDRMVQFTTLRDFLTPGGKSLPPHTGLH